MIAVGYWLFLRGSPQLSVTQRAGSRHICAVFGVVVVRECVGSVTTVHCEWLIAGYSQCYYEHQPHSYMATINSSTQFKRHFSVPSFPSLPLSSRDVETNISRGSATKISSRKGRLGGRVGVSVWRLGGALVVFVVVHFTATMTLSDLAEKEVVEGRTSSTLYSQR